MRSNRCSVRCLTLSGMLVSVFLGIRPAQAQEGLIDAMANDSAAHEREKQEQSPDYTYKSGDFKMLLVPSLSLQWNDNINCAETNRESDFILLPTLGTIMSYPLTDWNLLQVNVTMGYSDYLLHPDLSSYYLQSGSGLSFNMYIKDILINVHDQFSYVQDASQNPGVAGTGTYGTFQNSAGLSGKWNLKKVVFTLGYDHQNTFSTSSQFSDVDNSTESGYARTGYQWNSKLTTGVEATAAYTHYNEDVLNDNTSYSLGVYGDWQPDSFLHIQPRVGYTIDEFAQTSQSLQNSTVKSWYADLNISHEITRSVSYSLDLGRQTSGGAQSDITEDYYVNSGITWKIINGLTFQTSLSYQHGNQGEGTTLIGPPIPNSNLVSQEIYNWYNFGLGLSHDITRQFALSLNYQFTQRTSSLSDRGYTQNLVGIVLTYHPK
jgi:hypothetical protein